MATPKNTAPKAGQTPPENKSDTPPTSPPAPPAADPPVAPKPRPAAAEPDLSSADEKRRKQLAQSGYSLPAEQFAQAAEQEKRDAAIAKEMPSTDGSKPHTP